MTASDSDSDRGDDVYQPDAEGTVDDGGLLDAADMLTGDDPDPYDEGWSPPERPLGVEHAGTTAAEQAEGETLDQRLAEEVPDPALEVDDGGDGIGDVRDTDGEARDGEVGAARSGRLAPSDGRSPSTFARDVGVDGAGASAEEAAVHVVPVEEDED